jgi:hypothetical protein
MTSRGVAHWCARIDLPPSQRSAYGDSGSELGEIAARSPPRECGIAMANWIKKCQLAATSDVSVQTMRFICARCDPRVVSSTTVGSSDANAELLTRGP